MGALDDPAPSAPARLVFPQLPLLTTRADVGCEAELGRELVDLWIVVALIEAEALGPLERRFGPLERQARERLAEQLEVVYVRAGDREPDRDAAALAEQRALRPLFARSVGLGPVSAPPSGALPRAPSAESQPQSMPLSRS